MALQEWIRLPSGWIQKGGLRALQWSGRGSGSNNTAALMALTVIAHNANREGGVARLTYDALCSATGLCRAKLSKGLDVLEDNKVIEREPEGRSTYRLSNFNPKGPWAMMPANSMYSGGRIISFDDFQLRSATELNALKLYFLFIARRGSDTNMANISYDKIEEYAAVERSKIKAAISRLALIPLIYVEQLPSRRNELGFANAYRIVGLNPYKHMGTQGRGMDSYDFDEN
jgi:hypothetical protein